MVTGVVARESSGERIASQFGIPKQAGRTPVARRLPFFVFLLALQCLATGSAFADIACGKPSYNKRTEAALLLWKDCASGLYELRVTGGGSATRLNYQGSIIADEPLSPVTGFSLESSDTLDTANPNEIQFSLKVKNAGQDGFTFGFSSSASVTLDLTGPAGIPVLVGPDRDPVNVPFPINVPDAGACGSPTYNKATEAGVFLWRECGSNSWRLRVTAGGGSVTYRGSLVASDAFASVTGFSVESADTLDTSVPSRIDFTFKVKNRGQDGVDFAFAPGVAVTLEVTQPNPVSVFQGPGRVPVNVPYLLTGDAPPPPSCDTPDYDAATEAAVFVWKACDGPGWHLRTTGGGTTTTYVGRIVSDTNLDQQAAALEASDLIDTLDPTRIEFSFDTANADEDGFDFTFDWDAEVNLEIDAPPGVPIFAGVARVPVTSPWRINARAPAALAACPDVPADLQPANYAPPITNFVRDTVLDPVVDGISLATPDLAFDQPLVRCGIIDVTRPPFNADRTGASDATQALNSALAYARDLQLISYFPAGTYRITDTLECAQGLYRRQGGNVLHHRLGPCVLVGSRAGTERPKLFLAPNSPGFGDPNAPKRVVYIWGRNDGDPTQERTATNMNQMFVNLDIEVGAGNPGAVGIKMTGAQGTAIQETAIDVTEGYMGIEAPPGGGGSITDVRIIGGTIGIESNNRQMPTLGGVRLLDQSGPAIVHQKTEGLTGVGIEIRVPAGNFGPVVKGNGQGKPTNGPLNLVDSIIDFTVADPQNVAIDSNRSVYLNNVYIRNAQLAARFSDGTELPANPTGWRHVREYAHGVTPPLWTMKDGRTLQYQAPVYLDGVRTVDAFLDIGDDHVPPPADLQSRHIWDQSAPFPSFESASAANVKAAPYFAVGDGIADDTQAIQQALSENAVVFLPKGYYRISGTLEIPADGQLIGVARHLSILLPAASGDFADPANPQPLIRTADDADATSTLAFVTLFLPLETPGARAVHWRSGRDSLFRGIHLRREVEIPGTSATDAAVPFVVISGNGGGRWYNFELGSKNAQTVAYRHILVDGTTEPLKFYQLNPERVVGEAHVEISNARNVAIYGLKSEGNYPVLWIKDSDNIELFGYGGLSSALAAGDAYPSGFTPFTPSLLRVERTPNFRFANTWERAEANGTGTWAGGTFTRRAPDTWHFIYDDLPPAPVLTDFMDRPVLYRRGYQSNTAPSITTAGFSVTEGVTVVGTVVADDPDGDPLTFALTGNGADDALFTIDPNLGLLSFNTPPDFENPIDADGDNVYQVEISAHDGAASGTRLLTVTVIKANGAPSIITTDFTVPEDTAAVGTVVADDPDGDPLTFALTGNGVDDALFTVDPNTGLMSFIAPPDFENPADTNGDNVYDVEVAVHDGLDSSSSPIMIAVTDVNETPVIITSDFSVPEGTTTVGTVLADDPDGDPLTFALTGNGADDALFTIDPNSGLLSFNTPPDFENPADANGDNVYDVEVAANDALASGTRSIPITVTDISDPSP